MLLHVFTLRFDALLEGFDDTPVRDFVKDKEVLALGAHFFSKNQGHYLTVVVTYTLPSPTAAAAPRTVPARTPREAPWRDLLTEADLPLFNTLRDWRRTQSQREGIPPYIICNNRQCALLVRSRPQTLAALGTIEGFGAAKLERYGQALLALLASHPDTVPAPETPHATPSS